MRADELCADRLVVMHKEVVHRDPERIHALCVRGLMQGVGHGFGERRLEFGVRRVSMNKLRLQHDEERDAAQHGRATRRAAAMTLVRVRVCAEALATRGALVDFPTLFYVTRGHASTMFSSGVPGLLTRRRCASAAGPREDGPLDGMSRVVCGAAGHAARLRARHAARAGPGSTPLP